MTVLFSQHWDVLPGRHDDYSNFVLTDYNPALERIGIRMVGGYYVTVGMGPRIIAVGVVSDLHELDKALASAEFADITDHLMAFVTHYHSRILVPTGRVEMADYRVQTGLWKFNQYWNVVPGRESDYAKFVVEDLVPTLERTGLDHTAGWRVVVGSGPQILAECSAPGLVDIARALDSDEFRRVTHRLRSTFVTDYHSRILAPTGRIDLPHLLEDMLASF